MKFVFESIIAKLAIIKSHSEWTPSITSLVQSTTSKRISLSIGSGTSWYRTSLSARRQKFWSKMYANVAANFWPRECFIPDNHVWSQRHFTSMAKIKTSVLLSGTPSTYTVVYLRPNLTTIICKHRHNQWLQNLSVQSTCRCPAPIPHLHHQWEHLFRIHLYILVNNRGHVILHAWQVARSMLVFP